MHIVPQSLVLPSHLTLPYVISLHTNSHKTHAPLWGSATNHTYWVIHDIDRYTTLCNDGDSIWVHLPQTPPIFNLIIWITISSWVISLRRFSGAASSMPNLTKIPDYVWIFLWCFSNIWIVSLISNRSMESVKCCNIFYQTQRKWIKVDWLFYIAQFV